MILYTLFEFSIKLKISSRTSGWIIDSSASFLFSFLKISSLKRALSTLLFLSINFSPKCSRKSFFALSLSSRMFFETWSASITSIPNSIKKSPATDFPEPIPPVRPTILINYRPRHKKRLLVFKLRALK